MFNKLFTKYVPSITKVEKYSKARLARRQYGACALHAVHLRLQTHTQNMQHLLRFHCNNDCTNEPISLLKWNMCLMFFERIRTVATVRSYERIQMLAQWVKRYSVKKNRSAKLKTVCAKHMTWLQQTVNGYKADKILISLIHCVSLSNCGHETTTVGGGDMLVSTGLLPHSDPWQTPHFDTEVKR